MQWKRDRGVAVGQPERALDLCKKEVEEFTTERARVSVTSPAGDRKHNSATPIDAVPEATVPG
jgi:hypothetical protein